MALLGQFTKQPGETLDFTVNYSTVLAGRTDIISTKAVSVSPAGLTISSSTINVAGDAITVVVSSGTDNSTYRVTITATSNASPVPLVYEDEVDVFVDAV